MGTSSEHDDSSPAIKVCVRVRPFILEEVHGFARGSTEDPIELCVDMPSETQVTLVDDENQRRTFEFDRCYWSFSKDHPHFANQTTLHEELGARMIEHAMSGFNNCIIAYGQTGGGKSYSVLGGAAEDRGLLPRVVEGLFGHFARSPEGTTCKAIVSFTEIDGEQIRDLLAARDVERQEGEVKLEVRQHPVLGVMIPGLTEAAVQNAREVLDLIEYGTELRKVAETAMNTSSSRCHCIFTFKTSVEDAKTGQLKVSQTHLVDLAGSERAAKTKATGQRLREGARINKSLSVLARVISALASQSQTASGSRRSINQPPFRESKLTHILKESLSGNSKTAMIVAISPSSADYEETTSALKFAQSVKQVRTHAVCNEVSEKTLESQLRKDLEDLREQLMKCEAEKDNDAHKLVVAQRRLSEQESMCRFFGGDWEELLALERLRKQRRAALRKTFCRSPEDAASFYAQMEQMHRASLGVGARSSSSSGSSSPRSYRSSCSDESAEDMDTTGPAESGGSPGGADDGGKALHARRLSDGRLAALEVLQRRLGRLEEAAKEAEDAANALAGPGAPRLRLRARVAADAALLSLRGVAIDAELVVRAVEVGPRGELGPPTWLSEDELYARLARMLDLASQDGEHGPAHPDCSPWTRAAATSDQSAGAAATGATFTLEAEAAQLRSELAAAHAALADAQERQSASLRGVAVSPRVTPCSSLAPASPIGALAAAASPTRTRYPLEFPRGRLQGCVASSFADALGALEAAQAVLEGGVDPGLRHGPRRPEQRPRRQSAVA
eukprot:TRINITY_DN30951_c0_g1_i1.p1 TRINITY_DN30951_c0_g1~~TRINITY_DN30951_c0_g1_i1.p1  ORF type:complete len:816 (+),score=155.49 TRINITY_DN30951_c0_g1_i1:86-2449(+)